MREYTIKCSSCGVTGARTNRWRKHRRKIETGLRERGWRIAKGVNDLDLCHECQPKVHER